MDGGFELLAMALDTLPRVGRIALLAYLLSLALYGFGRALRGHPSVSMRVLFGKGALVAVWAMPLVVYVFGIEMPVRVSEVRHFQTPVPGYVVLGLLTLWLGGAVWRTLDVSRRVAATFARTGAAEDTGGPARVADRLEHWRTRLCMAEPCRVSIGGSEVPWHAGGHVVLPAAAAHWPAGCLDAALLSQLALIKQRAWRWLVFGRLVQAAFWPAPWVRHLVDDLAMVLNPSGTNLAQSAYRDPEGWRRDIRQLCRRTETLLPGNVSDGLVRLVGATQEAGTDTAPDQRPDLSQAKHARFEAEWADTKARLAAKHFDPYERVYWLIAGASIVVAVVMTLTVTKAPPEFEPQFLELRWQDGMQRRIRDEFERPLPAAPDPGPSTDVSR